MWSLGALLELADRDKLEEHIRTNYPQLDLPTQSESANISSVFDYRVDENGKHIKQPTSLHIGHIEQFEQLEECIKIIWKGTKAWKV